MRAHQHLGYVSATAVGGNPPGSDYTAMRNSSGGADLCWEQGWLSRLTEGEKELWKSLAFLKEGGEVAGRDHGKHSSHSRKGL